MSVHKVLLVTFGAFRGGNLTTGNLGSAHEVLRQRYADNGYTRLFLDSPAFSAQLLAHLPSEPYRKIRIYIMAHGHHGRNAIFPFLNSEENSMSVGDLARMFGVLQVFGRSHERNARNTEFNMLVCSFGRATEMLTMNSPAACFHRALREQGVYAEVIARTEQITFVEGQRATIPPLIKHMHGQLPVEWPDSSLQRLKKRPMTKVRYFFRGGQQTATYDSYSAVGAEYFAYDDKPSLYTRADCVADSITQMLDVRAYRDESGKRTEFIMGPDHRLLCDVVNAFELSRDAKSFKGWLDSLAAGRPVVLGVYPRLHSRPDAILSAALRKTITRLLDGWP